jgi:hypothetical protein
MKYKKINLISTNEHNNGALNGENMEMGSPAMQMCMPRKMSDRF